MYSYKITMVEKAYRGETVEHMIMTHEKKFSDTQFEIMCNAVLIASHCRTLLDLKEGLRQYGFKDLESECRFSFVSGYGTGKVSLN